MQGPSCLTTRQPVWAEDSRSDLSGEIGRAYYNIDLNVLWNTAEAAVPKTVAAANLIIWKYYDGAGGSGGPPV
jgi:hypothetical protein